VAKVLHHPHRFFDRFLFPFDADQVAPSGNIDAVPFSNDRKIGTVPFKKMGRFLLVPDDDFFYPFRSRYPFCNSSMKPFMALLSNDGLPFHRGNRKGSPGSHFFLP
jgi:hypothetical protein